MKDEERMRDDGERTKKEERVSVREGTSEKEEGKNKLPTHCFLGSVKLVSVRKGRRKKEETARLRGRTQISGTRQIV